MGESQQVVSLTISIGTIVLGPIFVAILVLNVSTYRRLKRLEKLMTPVRTDERGVRYYPPHEEIADPDIAQDVRRLRELREQRARELEDMDRQRSM